MTGTFGRIGIGMSCLALGGCSHIYAQSRVDPQTIAVYRAGAASASGEATTAAATPTTAATKTTSSTTCPEKLRYDTRSGALNLDCFHFPEDGPEADTAYKRAVGDDEKRNRLADILMKHSDDVCTIELGRLTANEAAVNATLSILTSGFSAASTVVTGDTAKSILSGLATLSNASRGHINAEVYRNVLSPAVARAIESERSKKEASIKLNLAKTSKEYSVDQMIREVNERHQTCSFYMGLTLVVDAVDRTKFNAGDQQTALEAALARLDTEIAKADKSKKAAAEDAPAIASIDAELKSYRDQRMTLVKQIVTAKAAAATAPGK